nr:hemicentin-1 [Bactrocera oleae]
MWAHNMALMVRGFSYETRWLLLLIVMCDMTNGGVQGPMESYNSLEEHLHALSTTQYPHTTVGYVHPKWIEPYFDPSTPRNVTALMGKSAYLSCRVRNLGNKTVSWIRHRDIHILTVGAYTYTSDQRFQATHHQDSDDWTLQIKWAQKRDAGMYECQISTQPVRSYFVRLNVVVPTATILGGPDLHVDKGSTINLTCTVKFSPEPPAYIFWYHHEEVINYDSSRGGVSVITEKGDVTTSFLLIQNADLADSGKYSCAPSNADVASVRVHVLNGEHPEAMQTGSSGCQFSWLTIFLLAAVVLGYQQQNFVHNATSVVGTTTTTTATKTIIAAKSNASESVVAAHKSATTATEAKGTVNRQLPHIKQTMADATVATTNTITRQATTVMHKSEMILKTTKTAITGTDLLAVDIYVALATAQKAIPDQQNSNGTAKEKATIVAICPATTITTRNLPATMATSSSVSVKDSTISITPPKAATTKATTTKSCCNTMNIPTSSNAKSHNDTAAGNAATQFQRTQENSRGSATPTTCGASVRCTKPKIDCNNMINKTASKRGNVNFAHFCNSSSNNNNNKSGNNSSRHTSAATTNSTCSKSHVTSVSCSNSNNNCVNCNNNNGISHQTTCHYGYYDVR